MTRTSYVIAIAIASMLSCESAVARDMVCPRGVTPCNSKVLSGYLFKAVILDFVDPQAIGIGDSLSRLLWRDVIYAISDLGSTAVVHAPAVDPGSEQRIERALGKPTTDVSSPPIFTMLRSISLWS